MEAIKTKLLFDKNHVSEYQSKLIFALKYGFLFATIGTLLFRKPSVYYPMGLGVTFGFCHSDLKKIFIVIKEKDIKSVDVEIFNKEDTFEKKI